MYHCDDCLVCIEDYDHHCVFFSKCIGGGNIKCFYGSMAMLLVNFVLVATMVAFAAFYDKEDPNVKKKVAADSIVNGLKILSDFANQ
jgi:hypothetical protein